MKDWKDLKDGEYYFISIACSFEGEYSNEATINILTQFHRVMQDFVDAEGHVSQSPTEWFVDVFNYEHFSGDVFKVRQARFCSIIEKSCNDRSKTCLVNGRVMKILNINCPCSKTSEELLKKGIKLNFESATNFSKHVYYKD
jgi:hypothetical protein